MLKIAIAQINPSVGDLEQNSAKIINQIILAQKNNADIVVFPELSISGYPPEDLLFKPRFIKKNLECLERIKKQTKGIFALVGFVDKRKENLYNACAVLSDTKLIDIYHKIFLPNYGVFDEKRYFLAGDRIPLYEFKGYRFGLSICEDIWEDKYLAFFKHKKLDFLINISASPFHLGKLTLRQKILARASRKLNCFIIYSNLVGGQDELVFDGFSQVYSPAGRPIHCAKRFAEDFSIFFLEKNKEYPSISYSFSEEEELFSSLSLGLQDYLKKNGFKKVIVGVSGGIDSAVVVSLATISLGKDKVCSLIMPSPYTSKETLNDAKRICKSLGIQYYLLDIERIFKAYLSTLKPYFLNKSPDKAEENIQARIRGNLLMAFSNKFGYLVLNTGNKSEVSCGYCTLYGDTVGGFGLLKDLYKLQVYKLAHYINRIMAKEIIPKSVLKRAPSAELKPNQKDSDTLPKYSLLDPILKLYIEENLSWEEIIKRGYQKELVTKIIRMVDKNEYKRRQSPLGVKISKLAFGRDRRIPITNKFIQ